MNTSTHAHVEDPNNRADQIGDVITLSSKVERDLKVGLLQTAGDDPRSTESLSHHAKGRSGHGTHEKPQENIPSIAYAVKPHSLRFMCSARARESCCAPASTSEPSVPILPAEYSTTAWESLLSSFRSILRRLSCSDGSREEERASGEWPRVGAVSARGVVHFRLTNQSGFTTTGWLLSDPRGSVAVELPTKLVVSLCSNRPAAGPYLPHRTKLFEGCSHWLVSLLQCLRISAGEGA